MWLWCCVLVMVVVVVVVLELWVRVLGPVWNLGAFIGKGNDSV